MIDLQCMQREMTLQVSVACTKAVVMIIRKTSEQSVDVPGVSYLYI